MKDPDIRLLRINWGFSNQQRRPTANQGSSTHLQEDTEFSSSYLLILHPKSKPGWKQMPLSLVRMHETCPPPVGFRTPNHHQNFRIPSDTMPQRCIRGTYSGRCPAVDAQSPGGSSLRHCCPHSRSVGYRPENQDTSIYRWCRWICTLEKHKTKQEAISARSLGAYKFFPPFPPTPTSPGPWWFENWDYLEVPGNWTQKGHLDEAGLASQHGTEACLWHSTTHKWVHSCSLPYVILHQTNLDSFPQPNSIYMTKSVFYNLRQGGALLPKKHGCGRPSWQIIKSYRAHPHIPVGCSEHRISELYKSIFGNKIHWSKTLE